MSKRTKNKIDPRLLQMVTDYKLKNVDRYYQTILYTIGLKNYCITNSQESVKFIGAELKLKHQKGELNPDIVLQAETSQTLGLPIEVKTSLSDNNDVLKNLKEMERYNNELSGWKTSSGKVDDHVIIFSPNAEDEGKVRLVLAQALSSQTPETKVTYSKKFIIWEWSLIQSAKFGQSEILIIKQTYNDLINLGIDDFNTRITKGITVNINDTNFIIEQQKNLLTRQKPPAEYLMIEMWNKILTPLCNENNEITVDQIIKAIDEFYTSSIMFDQNGNKFKVDKKWIRDALEKFELIGLAEEMEKDTYRIDLEKKTAKNISRYICEQLAKKQIKNRDCGEVNRIINEYQGLSKVTDFTQETEEL